MASAIELYRDAYDLDYRKGDWETAEELYRKIISDFPDSAEKEYALVHLDRIEKLKANPEDQPLQAVRAAGGSRGLSIFNFIFILLVAGVLGAASWFQFIQYRSGRYQDLILQGELVEKAGNLKTASELYQDAFKMFPEKRLAPGHLIELYIKAGKIDRAGNIYELWTLAAPMDPYLNAFSNKLNRAAKEE